MEIEHPSIICYMSRFLVILFVAFLSLPALAGQLQFYVDSNPASYGDPGLVVTYRVVVRNSEEPPLRDVTVTLALPPGELLQVSPQHPDWKCTSSPREVVCTRESLPVTDYRTDQPVMITMQLSTDRRGFRFETPSKATAKTEAGEILEAQSGLFAVTHALFSVTSSADSGPGTLRAAILESNDYCFGRVPCKILFELPPYTTIEPLTPLPAIEGCDVFMYGRQIKKGDRRLELSGARLTTPTGSGLEIRATCSGSVIVEDMAINRFPDYGILARNRGIALILKGVFLGTDITGRELRPNTRGLGVFFAEGGGINIEDSIISGNRRSGIFAWNGSVHARDSRFEHNGASGIFHAYGYLVVNGGTVAHNGEFGVAVSPVIRDISINGSSIHSNGITGIDWGLDGPSTANSPRPIPPPGMITDAYFDPARNVTVIEGTFPRTSVIGPLRGVQVYASRALNASGNAEGERFLGYGMQVTEQPDGSFTFVDEVSEDLRGQIVTVTVGSSPWLDSVIGYTTEFSAGVTVR